MGCMFAERMRDDVLVAVLAEMPRNVFRYMVKHLLTEWVQEVVAKVVAEMFAEVLAIQAGETMDRQLSNVHPAMLWMLVEDV